MVLSPLRHLFFFGVAVFLRCAGCFLKFAFWAAYTGLCSFSVALRWRYFLKNAPKKWAVYTGTSVLSLLRHLFFFGRGSPFFLRFQCGAVLYFRCWARGARLWLCFFVVFGRLVRLFVFAVSWLCECRLSHLDGGVNKKNTLPGGRPAKVEPAGARVRGAGEPQSGGQ